MFGGCVSVFSDDCPRWNDRNAISTVFLFWKGIESEHCPACGLYVSQSPSSGDWQMLRTSAQSIRKTECADGENHFDKKRTLNVIMKSFGLEIVFLSIKKRKWKGHFFDYDFRLTVCGGYFVIVVGVQIAIEWWYVSVSFWLFILVTVEIERQRQKERESSPQSHFSLTVERPDVAIL